MAGKPKVGIIGGGAIARAVIADIFESEYAELAFVLVTDVSRERGFHLQHGIIIDDAKEALSREVDLVVEAALPPVLAELAPQFLKSADVCGFSCTALADPATWQAISDAAVQSGHHFFVPHGAVLALDGLSDGREALESVRITTTKSGKSFGVAEDAEGLIFDGSAREACQRFPRNVNVHAAIAIAGLGFDRTESRIIASPGSSEMAHLIEVKGQGLEWTLCVASQSLGGVTGSYTPKSAVGSVRRILDNGGGIRIG